MKFVYISVLFSILLFGEFSPSYAGNIETAQILDITIPQEIDPSEKMEGTYIDIQAMNMDYISIHREEGVDIHNKNTSKLSGKIFCGTPSINGELIGEYKMMNLQYPQKTIPIDFESWDSNKAREYLDTLNIGKTVWKNIKSLNSISQQNTAGNVFNYFINPRQKWVKCISPSNTLPGKNIKKITYNIQIQYSKDTIVEFTQPTNGKKKWTLKPQKFGKMLGITMGSFLNSPWFSTWEIQSFDIKKIDGTNISYLQQYKDTASSGMEMLEIPKDSEIISITYTR